MTIPMVQREGGGHLLRDAEQRRFDELGVYKLNRLGPDVVDLLWVRRRLDQLGIRLVSVVEGEQDLRPQLAVAGYLKAGQKRLMLIT